MLQADILGLVFVQILTIPVKRGIMVGVGVVYLSMQTNPMQVAQRHVIEIHLYPYSQRKKNSKL